MKKIILHVVGFAVFTSYMLPLGAEESVCVRYTRKMNDCIAKELGAQCKKKPNCSICLSVNPGEEMKKAMEATYAHMECEGDFQVQATENLHLSCKQDKNIAETINTMKNSMKTIPECK